MNPSWCVQNNVNICMMRPTRQQIRVLYVVRRFQVPAGAGVAVEAFAIVIRRIELDVRRLRNLSEILHPHVMQSAPLPITRQEG